MFGSREGCATPSGHHSVPAGGRSRSSLGSLAERCQLALEPQSPLSLAGAQPCPGPRCWAVTAAERRATGSALGTAEDGRVGGLGLFLARQAGHNNQMAGGTGTLDVVAAAGVTQTAAG